MSTPSFFMQKAILSGWFFLFVLAEEQQPHGSECGCFAERITGRTISGIQRLLIAVNECEQKVILCKMK